MKTAKVMVLGALALVGAKLPAAESVWPEGLGNEKNVTVEFAGEFDYVAGDVKLVFSVASIARVKVNGEFAAYGPARPPLGYERQDEWNLTKFAKPGRNVIAIEVAGYNIGSFYLMKIPPYLKASVEVGGRTVLSTAVRPGPGVFTARRRLDRIQKVTRYCYQRPFAEAWRLPEERSGELRLSQTADYPTLSRRVPYPKFKVVPVAPVRRETLVRKETNYVDRAITSVGKEPNFEGFREGEYEVDLLGERQRYAITGATPLRAEDPRTLTPGTALVFADTLDRTGFFGFEFECRRPGRVILAFDEIEGRPLDWWMNASVDFTAPGRYRFETFDPSVAKVFRIYTFEAEGDVRGMWVREYENPEPRQAVFHSSDPQLNAIFGAAVQSLAANTLDTLMDCPGRERGSWLCDSTFTGRASTFLCGPSVERTFFEDWALGDLAWSGEKGILPPIYPANTYSGFMIRNWPIWLVVHAADFVARTGEREFADKLKPRLMSFIDYLREKYVDRASGYPTFDGIVAYMEDDCRARGAFGTTQAMLWVAALEAVDRLYGRPDCAAEAKALREKVLRERWNGTWFAASEKGDDITEAVQDYAFFFGFATPESHPGLWKRYVDELGPARRIEGLSGRLWTHPQVRPADVFPVGLMRLETLSRFGETAACFRDLSAFFGGMAEKTGTLWEFRHVQGSLCHGYPSYLLPILWAEALGVKEIDLVNKTIRIASPENAPLAYTAAALPLSGGFLEVSWRRTANGIDFNFSAPDGFEVKTEGVTNTCPRNPVLDGWYADPQIRPYRDRRGTPFRHLPAEFGRLVRLLSSPSHSKSFRRTPRDVSRPDVLQRRRDDPSDRHDKVKGGCDVS